LTSVTASNLASAVSNAANRCRQLGQVARARFQRLDREQVHAVDVHRGDRLVAVTQLERGVEV
jgi:hypothetical protein